MGNANKALWSWTIKPQLLRPCGSTKASSIFIMGNPSILVFKKRKKQQSKNMSVWDSKMLSRLQGHCLHRNTTLSVFAPKITKCLEKFLNSSFLAPPFAYGHRLNPSTFEFTPTNFSAIFHCHAFTPRLLL